MIAIKEELHKACFAFIENRLLTVKNTLSQIQESLLSETKSSAGDKHETGRAMLQLEREKAGNQLAEIQKVEENLSKVDAYRTSQTVHLGSVVYTTQANYYIAISAGVINLDKVSFYAISPSTPIGQILMSRTVGDTVKFRSQEFVIEKVL